jgi:hypothetical protein
MGTWVPLTVNLTLKCDHSEVAQGADCGKLTLSSRLLSMPLAHLKSDGKQAVSDDEAP